MKESQNEKSTFYLNYLIPKFLSYPTSFTENLYETNLPCIFSK